MTTRCHPPFGHHLTVRPTLSNSSIQTTPPSARTMAPPSMMKFRDEGSLITEAVRPAALLPFPEVYTWGMGGVASGHHPAPVSQGPRLMWLAQGHASKLAAEPRIEPVLLPSGGKAALGTGLAWRFSPRGRPRPRSAEPYHSPMKQRSGARSQMSKLRPRGEECHTSRRPEGQDGDS